MEICAFKEEYRDGIHRLVQEFHAESLKEYGIGYEPAVLHKAIDDLKDYGLILVIDGKVEGVITGKPVTTPYSSEKVWHEVIWYVSKEHRRQGLRLFKAMREDLKAKGYKAYVMVYMHNSKSDKLDRLYRRMGLTPMETNFIGSLQDE